MAKGNSFLSWVVFSVVTAILLMSCSPRLSDRQAKTDLQKTLESRWPGAVLVIDYETVKQEPDGPTCVVEYKAKARFIKDVNGCVQTCCGDICIDKMVQGFRWITKASDNPRVVRKGDLFETRGRKTYSKTEQGRLCEGL